MRNLCLIAVGIALLSGALAAKLYSWWSSSCSNVRCDYLQVRMAMFDQMIAASSGKRTYLVIGDSLTEIGYWPTMCGRLPVPAGISSARSDTWLPHAKPLARSLRPDVVVLAVGTNDLLTLRRLGPYEQLVTTLADYRLVAVPIHQAPALPPAAVREANRRIASAVENTADAISAVTSDGLHMTAMDYADWFAAIERKLCAAG
jgi:lysophospholipase L1-like esterase